MAPMPFPALPRPDRVGPILHFRGTCGGEARFAVTLGGGAPGDLVAPDGTRPEPAVIGTLDGMGFRTWRFGVPLDAGQATYMLDGARHDLALPEPGGALRLAFASCNGGEDEEAASRFQGGRNAMWRDLARAHGTEAFHLLVLGGDQIYADALWDLPPIAAWKALPARRRHVAPFADEMRRALERHYLEVYAHVFNAPEVAPLVASIPCVMMWDDHDIVDGWGSRPARWQESPVARGLFSVARRAFALVQLGCAPDAPSEDFGARNGEHFGWSADYGPARVVVPDLRSERTRHRVLGASGHAHLQAALEGMEAPHALVVMTVPLVNADLSLVERLVTPLTPVADLYQDDLRDQWMSFRHRAEWHRVTGRLLDLARGGTRVSLLSGEIHFGALATAERDEPGGERTRLEQFIASGIAHPPPPPALARAFERFSRRPWRRGDKRLATHEIAPDGRSFLAERNWLELTAAPDGALHAVLHAERSGEIPLVGRTEDRPSGRTADAA